jgi:hypothetical protein
MGDAAAGHMHRGRRDPRLDVARVAVRLEAETRATVERRGRAVGRRKHSIVMTRRAIVRRRLTNSFTVAQNIECYKRQLLRRTDLL